MNYNSIARCLIPIIVVAAASASAHDHPVTLGGSMKHVIITLDQAALGAYIGDPGVPMPELRDLLPPGDVYTSQAAVLNGTAHNAQYGWMASPDLSLPGQSGIFVRLLDQTPGLRTYTQKDMNPLFGTDGASDTWHWPGGMVHNWYAIDLDLIHASPQPIYASYLLYIGSIDPADYAQPLDGYLPANVQLDFTAVPEPSVGMTVIGLAMILARRRRIMRQ